MMNRTVLALSALVVLVAVAAHASAAEATDMVDAELVDSDFEDSTGFPMFRQRSILDIPQSWDYHPPTAHMRAAEHEDAAASASLAEIGSTVAERVQQQRMRFRRLLTESDLSVESLTAELTAELRDGLIPHSAEVSLLAAQSKITAEDMQQSWQEFLMSDKINNIFRTLTRWGVKINIAKHESFEDHGFPRRLQEIDRELQQRMALLKDEVLNHPRFRQVEEQSDEILPKLGEGPISKAVGGVVGKLATSKTLWTVAKLAAKVLGKEAEDMVYVAEIVCKEARAAVPQLVSAFNKASSPTAKIKVFKDFAMKKGKELYNKYKCPMCVRVLNGVVEKGCAVAIRAGCKLASPVCLKLAPACAIVVCPILARVLAGPCAKVVTWAMNAVGIKLTPRHLCNYIKFCKGPVPKVNSKKNKNKKQKNKTKRRF